MNFVSPFQPENWSLTCTIYVNVHKLYIVFHTNTRRTTRGGMAPLAWLRGGMPLPLEGLPPPVGSKKYTQFCNLAIHE